MDAIYSELPGEFSVLNDRVYHSQRRLAAKFLIYQSAKESTNSRPLSTRLILGVLLDDESGSVMKFMQNPPSGLIVEPAYL